MDTRPADREARRPRGGPPKGGFAALLAFYDAGLPDNALVCPVPGAGLNGFLAGLAPSDRFAADAARFRAREGKTALLASPGGGPPGVRLVLGLEGREAPRRGSLSAAAAALAEGRTGVGRALPPLARHGWRPARPRFGRCLTGPDRDQGGPRRLLVATDPVLAEREAEARPRALTDTPAGDLPATADRAEDPVPRLPLRRRRRRLRRARLADIANVGKGPPAWPRLGALSLERVVHAGTVLPHFDLCASSAEAQPGRPRGGLAQELFAALGLPEARVG